MLNGAVTLGTLDGANIEIRDAAGAENFIQFGMLTEEVERRKAAGYHLSLIHIWSFTLTPSFSPQSMVKE